MNRKNVPEQIITESKRLHSMVNRLNLYICCGGSQAFDFDRVYSELTEVRFQATRLYADVIDIDPKFSIPEDNTIND